MKIVIINGALPQYDLGLSRAIHSIGSIFEELSVEVSHINTALTEIPFYDGMQSRAAETIMQEIKNADGVIFATPISPFSTGAALGRLMEYFDREENSGLLNQKNCMLLAVYRRGDIRPCLDFWSTAVQTLGGYDSVKIPLHSACLQTDPLTPEIAEMLEKHIEDYYRYIRQNRKFFIPISSPYPAASGKSPESGINAAYPAGLAPKKKPAQEIVQSLSLDRFTEKQEQDIAEITSYFAQKYSDDMSARGKEVIQPFDLKATPRAKTCLQMTASLPHYFQPQVAGGMQETIQLSISGKESFTACITIQDGECLYSEGSAENPGITIMADCAAWADVLQGKMTAQKAFMVGQLKVRGNFVLLTKFEQLFKIMK